MDVSLSHELDQVKWSKRLLEFGKPDDRRAIAETLLTFGLFLSGLVAAWFAWSHGQFWALVPLAIINGGFLLRIFVIQHDCGHGAMFTSSRWNDIVGRFSGVLTLTPYDYWRHTHALHHATSGDLDKRGFGDITTLTLKEYNALTPLQKLRYRAYRNPVTLFVIGPVWQFVIKHRMPFDKASRNRKAFTGIMVTNAGVVLLTGLAIWLFGWKAVLAIVFPMVFLGAMAGVWLFYVQHQFDPAYWRRAPEWEREKAALHGSSFYDLPAPLMWISGNIGIHHIHHVVSRIPFYRLPEALRAYPELRQVCRLTLWQSFKCVRLTLWDEDQKRMVGFREAALAA